MKLSPEEFRQRFYDSEFFEVPSIDCPNKLLSELEPGIELIKSKASEFTEFYHTCKCNDDITVWEFAIRKEEMPVMDAIFRQAAETMEHGEVIPEKVAFIGILGTILEPEYQACVCPFSD